MGLPFRPSSYLPLCKSLLFLRQPLLRHQLHAVFPSLEHHKSDGIRRHSIDALLIPMPKPFSPMLPSPPQQFLDSVQTHIQVLERRTEREPDKVMAGRVEEVSTVRGVDVEEDSWDHDRLFLEELFEEGLVCRETRVD